MTSNKLNSWNKDISNNIIEMYKTERKVAIQQPTGTGKSFITNCIIEHLNVSTLIICPTKDIINQFKEDYGVSADYMTYSKLLQLYKSENIDTLKDKYGLIVADELHRAAAKNWEIAFKCLADEVCSNAKILGASATPRRPDQELDMDTIELLFDGNRVGGMTLSEAISSGILPNPIYNAGMYSLRQEFESRIKKINDNKKITKDKKDFLMDFIAKQQVSWAASEGLDVVVRNSFESLRSKDQVKIVVFCNYISNIKEIKKSLTPIFESLFEEKTVISFEHHNENDHEFNNFKENESNTLKILYVVNKLNEGIHIDDIDGGIFLRQTSSYIVYYQQLGRFLSSSRDSRPIILDLVNNFKSLNVVNQLKSDIETSIGSSADGDKKYPEKVEVIFNSHIKESLSILSNLDKLIFETTSVFYDYNAEKLTLSEIAKRFSLNINVTKNYLENKGFTVSQIEILSKLRNKKEFVNGELLSKKALANKLKISVPIISAKMAAGMSFQQINDEVVGDIGEK